MASRFMMYVLAAIIFAALFVAINQQSGTAPQPDVVIEEDPAPDDPQPDPGPDDPDPAPAPEGAQCSAMCGPGGRSGCIERSCQDCADNDARIACNSACSICEPLVPPAPPEPDPPDPDPDPDPGPGDDGIR